MSGPAPALAQGPQDLSGIWSFTHFDDRFQGWVTLQQSGSTLQGTWHTSSGKSEPDTPVTGSVDGAAGHASRRPPPHLQALDFSLVADDTPRHCALDGCLLPHPQPPPSPQRHPYTPALP